MKKTLITISVLTLSLTPFVAYKLGQNQSTGKYSTIGTCFVKADLDYQNAWGKECFKEGKSLNCEDISRGLELSTKLTKDEAACMRLYK